MIDHDNKGNSGLAERFSLKIGVYFVERLMGLGPSNLAIIQADDDLRRLEWGDIEVRYDEEMRDTTRSWLPIPVLPLF